MLLPLPALILSFPRLHLTLQDLYAHHKESVTHTKLVGRVQGV